MVGCSSQGFIVDAFAMAALTNNFLLKMLPVFHYYYASSLIKEISTTSYTAAHNGRNLGDSHATHLCIISKNVKMFFVRKISSCSGK
jgi:hypothetical protein